MLSAIEIMNLAELRKLWSEHFCSQSELRSTDLMRLMLSWRLQARVHGGLDGAMRRKLRRKTMADSPSVIDFEIGSVLRREWQGKTYEVEVEGGGFRWQGEIYASWSAAAAAIKRTRWNGPRLFGIRKGKP